MSRRIVDHPHLGKLDESKKITFTFDGQTFEGYEHDTIASALLANGVRKLREHEESGTGRGIYCNIGHCFECRVAVNNVTNVRACLTPIQEGMTIESGKQLPHPLHPDNDHERLITYEHYRKWKEELK